MKGKTIKRKDTQLGVEGWRERDFDLLVHIAEDLNSQDWARPSSGFWNFIQLFYMIKCPQHLGYLLLLSQVDKLVADLEAE